MELFGVMNAPVLFMDHVDGIFRSSLGKFAVFIMMTFLSNFSIVLHVLKEEQWCVKLFKCDLD